MGQYERHVFVCTSGKTCPTQDSKDVFSALRTAVVDAGLKARVALEIASVPTILDLVHDAGFHAVLTLNAIRRSGNESRFQVRPIGKPRLAATLRSKLRA